MLSFGEAHRIMLPGQVTAIDFTNDGSLVAVSLSTQEKAPVVRVYRTADRELVAELGEEHHAARGVAWGLAGKYLYYNLQTSSRIELWRAPSDGKPKMVAPYPMAQARSLVRDREGDLLAVVGDSVIVWDLRKPKPKIVAHVLGYAEDKGTPMRACFSGDSPRMFIYGTKAGKVVLHDPAEQRDLAEWEAPTELGEYLGCSSTGRYLVAVGFNNNGAWVRDTESGKPVATESFGPDSTVLRYPVFSFDESLLVTFAMNARAYRVPSFEMFTGPPIAGRRTWAVASAWEAPIVGFGIDDDALVLVHLE